MARCREDRIFPAKLQRGDVVRVVAPSRSLAIISEANVKIAVERFSELGLTVTFGRHVRERTPGPYASSSVESRLADLHEAFADKGVKAIFTVIGGFNVNQLLHCLDYELIRQNPKVLCGFSDITALQNAIFAKSGVVTYSGPHFSSLGMLHGCEYTIEHLQKCLFQSEPFAVLPSPQWRCDPWYMDQETVNLMPNAGHVVLRAGSAEGVLVGGNLEVLSLLVGTPFLAFPANFVWFWECADECRQELDYVLRDQRFQAFLQVEAFRAGLRGVVIGRFEAATNISVEDLQMMVDSKDLLPESVPVVANLDFGHTTPIFTFPVGGSVRFTASAEGAVELCITEH